MGLVGRMFRPKAMNSGELERMIRSVFGGGPTSSGVTVSSDSAMRQATVYSCVNILSRVLGMLPCHMMEKIGKTKNIADDFYLYRILHDMPNQWMDSSDFWGMAMNHLALRGNFYAFKNTGLDPNGRTRELLPIAPGRVQEIIQTADYGVFYRILLPSEEMRGQYGEPTNASIGTSKIFPASQIFHLRGMTQDGLVGMNPIQYVRECIGLGLATEQFGARHFGSGTHPSMIVTHPNQLKDTKAMRDALNETYGGLDNSHKVMLLEDGMTATSVSIHPHDSQYLETRKFQKSEIVDIFFCQPLTVMNAGETNPTFASAEQFSIGFIVYAILPWAVTCERGIYRCLLNDQERKRYYAKFRAEGLQRGSFKEQMEGFQTAVNTEILNPNECRELMDRNPYAGGEIYQTRTSTVKEPAKQTDQGVKQ